MERIYFSLAISLLAFSGCGVRFMGDDEAATPAASSTGTSTNYSVTSTRTPTTVSPRTITATLADKITNVVDTKHLKYARAFHTETLLTSGTHAGKVLFVGGTNQTGDVAAAELWDPAGNSGAGSFTVAGSLPSATSEHSATLLTSGTHAGKVLIVGGSGMLFGAQLWDPDGNSGAGSFTATGGPTVARYSHSATLLTSGTHAGKVLVVSNQFGSTSAELWDPNGNGSVGSFSATGSLTTGRHYHTATLLTSGSHAGKVLVIGGRNGGVSVSAAELWDPDGNAGAGSFAATGSLAVGRKNHTAVLLTSGVHAGKVFVAGGLNGAGNVVFSSAELWDPDGNAGAGSFSNTGALVSSRGYHTATLIPGSNGNSDKVLLVGGHSNAGPAINTSELWNSASASSSVSGSLTNGIRHYHSAVRLTSGTLAGKVLIAAGYSPPYSDTRVELWDPDGGGGAGSFSAISTLSTARSGHTSTVLTSGTHSGKVLLVGGAGVGASGAGGLHDSAELYDPTGNGGLGSFTATGSLAVARRYHTATLITSGAFAGRVMIIGGESGGNTETATIELWDPDGNSGVGSFSLPIALNEARTYHSATYISSGAYVGQVLVAGGYSTTVGSAIGSAEICDPAGACVFTGSLSIERQASSATEIPSGGHSGKVLVTGGRDALGNTLASAELWDPDGNAGAGAFAATGSMNGVRHSHTATLLTSGVHSGKVLVVGGAGGTWTSADLWDPAGNAAVGSFTATGSLTTGRARHTATLINSGPNIGKVLIAGGITSGSTSISAVEIWDPTGNTNAGTFSTLSDTLSTPRYYHVANYLSDGRIFIHGGSGNAESETDWALYSPFETVSLSVSGGTAPYSASVLSGTGAVYWSGSGGLFVPATVSTSTVRVTGTDGSYDESVITSQ